MNKFDSPSSFFALANFTTAFERNLLTEIRLFNKFITILKKVTNNFNLSEPFDYELFLKALKLYNGQHNFSAFTTADGRQEMYKTKKNPIKTVRIEVTNKVDQFLRHYSLPDDDKCNVIEVEITAESFLYKMIRKMVRTKSK